MNRLHRFIILMLSLGFAAQTASLRGQEAAEGEDAGQRVQYQLVLPDEKTPETVKPEEHNPFESESEAMSRTSPGDTEENRVRDKLLKLPVVGVRRMTDGSMRVLLGNISLEIGKAVPAVLPDQMVELKVKNITTDHVELAWQEKRATGLPPKLMIIPINIAPKVRYKMLGQGEEETQDKGPDAIMDMALHAGQRTQPGMPKAPATAEAAPPRAGKVIDDESPPSLPAPSPLDAFAPTPVTPAPVQAATPPPQQTAPAQNAAPVPPAGASPPPSPAVESMVRMLFGNPTPAPK